MMLASNNGVGMNFGFPDVCLTPAAPAPIPVPYPNLALNAMAVPFSPNIFIGMMPSLNMASKIPMTMGDEGGLAHPLFKQMGQYTMGNPFVLINCCPGVNLLCPTTGNMMNNPLGAVVLPSVTTTFFTDAGALDDIAPARARPASVELDARGLRSLRDRVGDPRGGGEPAISARMLGGGVACLRVARFVHHAATRAYAALRRLDLGAVGALVIDLRGNPGGDAEACFALASELLPDGALMAWLEDGDGDRRAVRARGGDAYGFLLAVLVDERTASAAELFAAALRHHGRAALLGARTAGKASAQAVVMSPGRGAPEYATVARYLLPGGGSFERVGLTPDAPAPRGLDDAVARLSAGG